MEKFIDKANINQVILPLSLEEAWSLENYFTETIVLPRDRKEFVVVVSEEEMVGDIDEYGISGVSLISYGRYDRAQFFDAEKIEIEALLIGYGRQWLMDNDITVLEIMH